MNPLTAVDETTPMESDSGVKNRSPNKVPLEAEDIVNS